MQCSECGKPILNGTMCLPCTLEQEELDKEEQRDNFQPLKKQTVIEK